MIIIKYFTETISFEQNLQLIPLQYSINESQKVWCAKESSLLNEHVFIHIII